MLYAFQLIFIVTLLAIGVMQVISKYKARKAYEYHKSMEDFYRNAYCSDLKANKSDKYFLSCMEHHRKHKLWIDIHG